MVAVWDLIRGVCKGAWDPDEIESLFDASPSTPANAGTKKRKERRSPRDVLEAVKERVEGEAVVAAWCSVDTKMGLLNVHMNERCFEAELYADELINVGDRRDDVEDPRCVFYFILMRIKLIYGSELGQMGTEKSVPRIHTRRAKDALEPFDQKARASSSTSRRHLAT